MTSLADIIAALARVHTELTRVQFAATALRAQQHDAQAAGALADLERTAGELTRDVDALAAQARRL